MESCPAPILARGPRAGAFSADVSIQVRCLRRSASCAASGVSDRPNSFAPSSVTHTIFASPLGIPARQIWPPGYNRPMFLGCRALLFSLLARLLLAQASPQEVIIRTHAYRPPSAILRADTNLVETRLIVRDSRGIGVAGLHASDFEVLDNGAPRPIASFTEIRTTPAPRPAADAHADAAKSLTLPRPPRNRNSSPSSSTTFTSPTATRSSSSRPRANSSPRASVQAIISPSSPPPAKVAISISPPTPKSSPKRSSTCVRTSAPSSPATAA